MPELANLPLRVAVGREDGLETGLGIILHGMIMINTKNISRWTSSFLMAVWSGEGCNNLLLLSCA